MGSERVVPVTIALPKQFRDLLRKMALEANMKNLDRTITVSEMGREIIVEHLKKILEARKGAPSNDNTFDNQ